MEPADTAEVQALDSRIVRDTHSGEPATSDSHSMHVLLVDDDTLARHVVRKALEKFGYQGMVIALNFSRQQS
jgi:hypothetical protein